jgi:hypothetical protein
MNLIDSHKKLSNTSGRFLRLLNSIVDTDPSAFSVITTENNENN